jgi:hypothetical protein
MQVAALATHAAILCYLVNELFIGLIRTVVKEFCWLLQQAFCTYTGKSKQPFFFM